MIDASILSTETWVLIIGGVVLLIGGLFFFKPSGKRSTYKSGGESNETIVTLKIQAFERLVLYLERIRFNVLVKRVFLAGMTPSDFQFALIQNIQDEFEHNLAQRLYVNEETWFLIVLAKDEALKVVNQTFAENADADAPMLAQIIASKSNSLIDRTIIAIKKEFNEF